MKKPLFLIPVVAAAGLLVGSPAAKALNLKPQLVTAGSTFNFDLLAGNSGTGASYYLFGPTASTFGSPTTVTGPDGQVITLTSSETFGATTTTDTFSISTTSASFYNENTANGTTINAFEFDVGDTTSGGAVPVTGVGIASYSAAGTYTDGTGASTMTANLPSSGITTMVAANGLSYGAGEGVNSGSTTTPIASYDVHGFTYSITYNTLPAGAPEPATWVGLSLGIAAGIVVIRRRHKTA